MRGTHAILLFDIVRIVAVGMIVAFHIGQHLDFWWSRNYPTPVYNVTLGYIGVTLLVVLSGAVLRVNDRHEPLASFYLRRFTRIYPTYWQALLCSFAIGLTVYRQLLPKSWSELALSVTGFCAFAGQWGCHLETSWFIGLIMSLYLLYPFLSAAMDRAPRLTILTTLAISLLSRLTVESFLPRLPVEWFPLCRLFEFALGIYLIKMNVGAIAPQWQGLSAIRPLVRYLSDLSFPMFLIHVCLFPVQWHFPGTVGILMFLAASLVVSHGILMLDRMLQPAIAAWGNAGASRRARLTAPSTPGPWPQSFGGSGVEEDRERREPSGWSQC